MDWFFEASDAEAFRALRGELLSYVHRHAEERSDDFETRIIFEELVGNAIRHASGPIWVSVDWSARSPVLTVHDLGPGFELTGLDLPDPLSESQRGLFMVAQVADQLRIAHKRAGGTRVQATLPVARKHEEQLQPTRSTPPSLPAPEEARDDGTFGKEAFLRALVVELAQAVELQQGPAAAEAGVSHVGLGVGGRMEEEYRKARGITGRLTPDQMADLFVRLKHAIDGGFYLVEADEDRIVLGNTNCPFGDVVRKAPALCRMTSSVFGGIAARNTGEGAVQLEERIAVGDPHCRVTVWLRRPEPEAVPVSHHYTRPQAEAEPPETR